MQSLAFVKSILVAWLLAAFNGLAVGIMTVGTYSSVHCDPFNSLAPGKCCCNFEFVIFKVISMTEIWSISCEIALR